MSIFSQVAKNTLVQLVGRAGVVLFTLVTTILLTRALGPSGYGGYVFIVAAIMFFVTLSDWGTGLISVREASKNEAVQSSLLGQALVLRASLSLVSLFLLVFLINVVPGFEQYRIALLIGSLSIFLISLKTSYSLIFQTKLRFEFMAATEIIISGFFLLFLSILVFGAKNLLQLESVMFCFFASNSFGVIFSWYWSKKFILLDKKINPTFIKNIFSEALPTGALLTVFSIYNRLDIILLQHFSGSEAVGYYGLAYKIHDNFILGAAYLSSSLFPIIAKYANNKNKQNNLPVIYQKTFHLLLFAGILIFLFVFLFSRPLINFLAGEAFVVSNQIIRLLVFATLFAYLNHLTGYTLIALGKQRFSLAVAFLALLINLLLNLIFVPYFSFWASAGITIITEGFVFVLTVRYLSKHFSLKPSLLFHKTIIEIFKFKGKIF